MKFFKWVIAALFPKVCAVCGTIIDEDECFCDYCYEMLERTSKDLRCLKCGMPKKRCECSKYIFRFDGLTAPFYYADYSKKAMFAFKFNRKEEIGKIFARYMALSVNESFYGVSFDLIAAVPMSRFNKMQRGYNQSEVLAREISKILGVPMAENLLVGKKKRYVQHSLPHKQRHENVKDKYFCNYRVNGKTVLLVDDIKTTGATLDECAKQLLRNGAERVYCVTGLITVFESEKSKKREKTKDGFNTTDRKRKDK